MTRQLAPDCMRQVRILTDFVRGLLPGECSRYPFAMDKSRLGRCPKCGEMVNVYTLENGTVYLGCDEIACLWASHLDSMPIEDS